MFYVYILECKDKSYYTGYTDDLDARVEKHNAGKGAKYTKGRGPVKVVWSREFNGKHDAMSTEYKLKQLTKQQKEVLIKRQRKVFIKTFG